MSWPISRSLSTRACPLTPETQSKLSSVSHKLGKRVPATLSSVVTQLLDLQTPRYPPPPAQLPGEPPVCLAAPPARGAHASTVSPGYGPRYPLRLPPHIASATKPRLTLRRWQHPRVSLSEHIILLQHSYIMVRPWDLCHARHLVADWLF